jgi:protein-tyrosine phosphatase
VAQVLVVCTGNICRSPMAEGFLRELFRRRTEEGSEPVEVLSAGVSAWDGSPATPEAVAAAAERDADVASHRARRLTSDQVQQADLVLAMTGDHAERVLGLDPKAAPRTFTLKELVRLVEALLEASGAEPPADRLRSRVASADRLRVEGFEGNPHDEDVADPIGMSLETYRAVAWELDRLSARLVDGLLGPQPAPSSLSAMWREGE